MSDCCPLCSLLGRPQHPVCNTAAGVVTLAAGTPEEHAQLLAGLFLNARQQVAVAGSACHCLHTAHQLVAGMGPEELLAGTVFTLQHMTLVHRAHGRAGPMPGLDARQASGWSHNSSGQGWAGASLTIRAVCSGHQLLSVPWQGSISCVYDVRVP